MQTSVRRRLWLFGLAMVLGWGVRAQGYVVEPDDYADGTVLDRVLPVVHLTSAGADNLPIPPVPFEVTATADLLDLAPTRTNVFGQANVPFWNSDCRLRMEFTPPVAWVAIDFAGGAFFTGETGQLDGYNAAGQRVASYVTAPQAAGHPETMTIVREAADIAWAVAFVPPDLGVFGRLDYLRFGGERPALQIGVTNGIAVLSFSGVTNLTYRVWASEDLRAWAPVGVPTQVEPGRFMYADLGVFLRARRYYRVGTP